MSNLIAEVPRVGGQRSEGRVCVEIDVVYLSWTAAKSDFRSTMLCGTDAF